VANQPPTHAVLVFLTTSTKTHGKIESFDPKRIKQSMLVLDGTQSRISITANQIPSLKPINYGPFNDSSSNY
jgi:hypothetical protein